MFDSRRDIFGSETQANAEKRRLKKGKAGASPRGRNVVIYGIKYITD
jgi:hypothetical protein